MAYIAQRRLVTTAGVREHGDPVPEAADWKNLRSYLGAGHIKEVPDSEVAPKAKTSAKAKAAKTVDENWKPQL